MSSYSSELSAKDFPRNWVDAFYGIPDYREGENRKNADFQTYKIGITLHKYKLALNLK